MLFFYSLPQLIACAGPDGGYQQCAHYHIGFGNIVEVNENRVYGRENKRNRGKKINESMNVVKKDEALH